MVVRPDHTVYEKGTAWSHFPQSPQKERGCSVTGWAQGDEMWVWGFALHFPFMWPWTSHSTSLNLHFFICKVRHYHLLHRFLGTMCSLLTCRILTQERGLSTSAAGAPGPSPAGFSWSHWGGCFAYSWPLSLSQISKILLQAQFWGSFPIDVVNCDKYFLYFRCHCS